jgi:predicted AAA+ superfamily ATPase
MSTQLVLDYLNYLETAQFIFCVKRMDIKGKKVFEIGEKYYFEDIGIRNSIVGYSIQDIHKLLENCVLHHLKISGYSVFIGNDDTKEIDFVAEKNGERLYIQVAYLLQDEQTIEREFGNLLAIPDNYPKYVVTMDTSEETGTYLGIKRMHIKDFCLMITSTN